MPRPKFVTCQICGKGFGSASIDIHVPQCYEKALKRWKLDPSGPRPVMPATQQQASRATAKGTGTVTSFGDDLPVGGGASAARGIRRNTETDGAETAPANPNLYPCKKCGRTFNYDRIGYHESVCKGDTKRRAFDSRRQRSVGDEDMAMAPRAGRGSRRTGGERGGYKVDPDRPIKQTNWREEHRQFIQAVRSAKRSDSTAQAMWGAPASKPAGGAASRSVGGAGAARGGGASLPAVKRSGGAKPTVPRNMVRQNQFIKANAASGGRAARAANSTIETPGTRRAAPTRDTMTGPAGGGGGGYQISNDNTTSTGMLQAFGRA